MATSLLQGKRFYCREWAFSKLKHCLENRAEAPTGGVLITGGPGCGKTALCCELVWPVNTSGRQVELSKRVLAAYFCQAHDIETLSIVNFIHSLVEQLKKTELISGYADQLEDPTVKLLLEPGECERNPDEAFKKAVLLPLISLTPVGQTLFLVVDSLDESYMQSINDRATGSRTIAELLSNHSAMFPQWLLLVCSARKHSKSITRLFTGFRKIALDDLRKSHVVRDVQQYILCRLDAEENLRAHLSRDTAEMLNQLHIKSNGCFLYLQKVLDGVADSFILLREIREIPGTLNGLYLWLCQRLFVRKQFSRIQPILSVILAARRPLTEMELYSCAYTRDTTLTLADFQVQMTLLSKLLIEGSGGTKILFHNSFAEWLIDVKHCTQKYLCVAAEGHAMLSMSFTLNAHGLTAQEVQDFALHLSKVQLKSPLGAAHLALWLVLSGAHVENSLSVGLPKEPDVIKLLHDAGARVATPDESLAASSMAASVMTSSIDTDVIDEALRDAVDSCDITRVDAADRTMLHTAAYQGNVALVRLLIRRGANLEARDRNGQVALNLAARQGHVEVVAALLKSDARVDHPDNEGWTPLRSAAWGGHVDVVSQLLQVGAHVDCTDSEQRTALRAAAWGGHEEIVSRLLESQASVNQVDNEGRTALIAASYMGHCDIVERLLEYGADVNHADIDGRTALSVACLCIPASVGHSSVVSVLLERGATVHHRDNSGMTPLLVAAYEGHRDVCELLLENDSDVDATDKLQRTPLIAAASMGHPAVVELLLFWGAAVDHIDQEGRTVLTIAAQQGSLEVVRQLLDRGLDELHRDNNGWTPLHMAAFEGHKPVIEALVEAGSRVTEIDNEGRVPLVLAAQEGHIDAVASLISAATPIDSRGHDGRTSLRVAALEGHADLVKFLLEKNSDLNYRDADGRSTLYVLALENHVAMAELLLSSGCDPEATDVEGRKALHVAAWQGHAQVVEVLLRHSANPNALDNDSRTALQSAAWQGHNDIVRLLLRHNAAVDHACDQGATALCIAAQEGHTEVVRALLEFGANPNHADQFGRTATRVALKGNHIEVVKLLEQYGAVQTSVSSRHSNTPTGPLPDGASTGRSQTVTPPFKTVKYPESPRARRHAQPHKPATNHSSNNTSSTNQSHDSSLNNSSIGLSFTQQLQERGSRHRHARPASRLLSPVGEPPDSPLVAPSPPSSPSVEQQSFAKLSDGTKGSSAHSRGSRESFGVTTRGSDNSRSARTSEHSRSAGSLHSSRTGSGPRGSSPPRTGSGSRSGATASDEGPVWQRRDVPMSGIVMGQSSLRSPDSSRRKRNGIVTNPNFHSVSKQQQQQQDSVGCDVTHSYRDGVSMNGYYNKLANLPDNFPVTPNGNSHLGRGTNNGGKNAIRRGDQNARDAPKRPQMLPLKKETPL